MKFTDFKTKKAEEIRTKVTDILQRFPEGKTWAGQRVIHDESTSPFELDALNNLTCLTCGGALHGIKSPSGAPNITYYTCQGDVKHKFLRVEPMSGFRKMMSNASRIISGQPLGPTDADLEALDVHLDHMGRLADDGAPAKGDQSWEGM